MIDTKTLREQLPRAAALLLAVTAATGMAVAAAAPDDPAMPQSLLEMTNTARTQQGLAPLQWDDNLAHAAQAHAELAVQNGQLSHQYSGEAALMQRVAQAGVHFQIVAENMAEGRSAEAIQDQWMNSPPHRANILDPSLNAVGFAVVRSDNLFYAVADFVRTQPNLSVDQIEAGVAKLLTSQGLQISSSHQDARQTCEMEDGAAGNSSPRFVERWQCADASRLPAEFEQKLQSKQYKSAAVGACGSPNAGSGITTYRVAVLLY